MTHPPLKAVVLVLALLSTAPAQAREAEAQQWQQTKRSVVRVDPAVGAGKLAADKLKISNLASDIRFDPRALDDSRFTFSVQFAPLSLPGNREIDDDILRMGAARFDSTEIRQTGDESFDALGMFSMNGRQQQVKLSLTVSSSAANTTPTLVFRATLLAPIGQMAPALALPKYIPVMLAIETTAAP